MKTNSKTPLTPNAILYRTRTLIVDDHALFLSYLQQFLDAQASVQVVGTAANGSEALCQADVLTPDLVLMDLRMPCMDGLQATVLLRRNLPDTRIIIMTLEEPVAAQAAARVHGAHGFIDKSRIVDDLIPEIRRVFQFNHDDDEKDAV